MRAISASLFSMSALRRRLSTSVLNIKDFLPAEPLLVEVVVHLVADPYGSKNLRILARALLLFLQGLADARLEEDGVKADKTAHLDVVNVQAPKIVTVCIRCPDDVLLRCFVLKQDPQCCSNRICVKVNKSVPNTLPCNHMLIIGDILPVFSE